jgi:hypothetical protein
VKTTKLKALSVLVLGVALGTSGCFLTKAKRPASRPPQPAQAQGGYDLPWAIGPVAEQPATGALAASGATPYSASAVPNPFGSGPTEGAAANASTAASDPRCADDGASVEDCRAAYQALAQAGHAERTLEVYERLCAKKEKLQGCGAFKSKAVGAGDRPAMAQLAMCEAGAWEHCEGPRPRHPILQALAEEGYEHPTPIQAQAIPTVLEGRDLSASPRPAPARPRPSPCPSCTARALAKGRPPRFGCRVLVLSPTRELASQIADSFRTYGRHLGLSVAVVFGGVGFGPQRSALRAASTSSSPRRAACRTCSTRAPAGSTRSTLVLDEADQMLDKGFLPAIRRLLKAIPAERQTLFFSATMPAEINRLAAEMLTDPVSVAVAPVATTAERVAQRVIHVEPPASAASWRGPPHRGVGRTLVFSRTKHGADRIVKQLDRTASPPTPSTATRRRGRASARSPPSRTALPRARRDRHRRPRHRRGRRHARHPVRPAQRARDLRPPHRPHRARRRLGPAPAPPATDLSPRRPGSRPASSPRPAGQQRGGGGPQRGGGPRPGQPARGGAQAPRGQHPEVVTGQRPTRDAASGGGGRGRRGHHGRPSGHAGPGAPKA